MRITALVAAAFALWALCPERAAAFASSSDKGTSGAQFLKIAPSARPAGMGEAFAGVADDVDAVYYNPAGLADLKKVEVTGSHTSLFQDLNYEYAAVSVPLLSWVKTQDAKNKYGVLGVSIYNLSVSNLERRGLTETDTPTDTFGSSDLAYALSYGYTLADTGLSLGATAKFIDQQLDTAKASAFALDAGSLYKTGRTSLAFGLRNAGTKTQFASQADPLPLLIYGGAAYRFSDNFLGSLELDAPRDNRITVGLGAEYRHDFGDRLTGSVRGGYNSRNTDAGGLSGASMGLGLGYGNFSFDFALQPFGDLGNAYKYSLLVRF